MKKTAIIIQKRIQVEKNINLKERIKEHENDGEKSRKIKKITSLSKHMKTADHSSAWDDIRII